MGTNAVGKGNLQAAIGAFKMEASMLISLRHKALLIISDFFSWGESRWYLVMDYIEGEALKRIVQRRGSIPQSEVMERAEQLCDILDYLHTRKPPVIFRDLKPDNIMLTPDSLIKLIDFGIARHFRAGATTDTSAMAPPVLRRLNSMGKTRPMQGRTYTLGATLHCLLTNFSANMR